MIRNDKEIKIVADTFGQQAPAGSVKQNVARVLNAKAWPSVRQYWEGLGQFAEQDCRRVVREHGYL